MFGYEFISLVPSDKTHLAREMPEKTMDLFGKLLSWLEENVDEQYWPYPDPDYNPAEEVRSDAPFVNLYQAYRDRKDVLELANLD